MAEVVVAGTAHFVALGAVVVFVTAHPDGVVEAGGRAFVLHHLLLLSGVHHPFVDAAINQQLLICAKDKHFKSIQTVIDNCKNDFFHS